MDGWTRDLPLLPGFYWVRIAGYERAPGVLEIIMQDRVPLVLHEEPQVPGAEGELPRWIPLADEYEPEDEAAFWGPMVPPE